MIDTIKYKDIRFTDSFNCSSFVKRVLSDNGKCCPIDFINHKDKQEIAESFIENRPLFEKTDKPRDFDLVYLKTGFNKRHLGLFFAPNFVYHLPREGSPLMQKIKGEVKNQIIGFYKLKKDA